MTTHGKFPTIAAAGILAAGLGTAAAADDNETVDHFEVGSLTCDVGEGTGFLVGSSRDMVCTFNPVQEGLADETYAGQINRWGVDIGETSSSKMSWLILAPTEQEFSEGGLNGDYHGISAEATFGAGLGANVLTGGSENTLALQPVSLTAQEGLNVAVGVAELQLQRVDG